MKKITLTSAGDCCIDHYVQQQKDFLGGSSFNVAYNAVGLGAHASIISSIGEDKAGLFFKKACKTLGIDIQFLESSKKPTSSIAITLDKYGSPDFTNWHLGALEGRMLQTEEKKFLLSQDIIHSVLFGSIEPLFAGVSLLSAPDSLKIGDFSGLSQYSESIVAIEKYGKGFDVIVKSLDKSDQKSLHMLKQFAKKYKKICIALLGSYGSKVFIENNEYTQYASHTHVVDTCGAGDAYIASFACEFVKTNSIQNAMEKATEHATKVIQHMGASGIEITE